MDRKVYDQMREAQDRHWWFCGRKAIIKNIIASLSASRRVDILEVGSGTGANLQMLAGFGRVTGCEYDDDSVQFTKSMGFDCVNGFLPDGLNQINGKYDIICMLDVLEHVEDDVGSISSVANYLKNGAYLVITCPAYQFLFSDYDKSLGHFRRYTSKSLVDAVRRGGLIPIASGYFNTLLFPLSVFAKILSFFGVDIKKDATKLPSPLVNSLLKKIFLIESVFGKSRLFPFGTTVVCVAKKE